MPKAVFPSLMTVAKDSWHRLTDRLLQLFGINIAVGLLSTLVIIIGAIATFSISSLNIDFTAIKDNPVQESFTNQIAAGMGENWRPIATGIGLTLLAATVVSLVGSIASFYTLASEKKIAVGSAVNAALPKLVPIIIMSLLGWVLTMGGFFLFIFPGIVVSFLLMFAVYELVLENNTVLGSLKRSVALVSHNLGNIIGYLLVYAVAFIVVFYLIPNVIIKIDEQTGLLLALLRVFLNFIAAWYSQVFMFMLYRAAKKNTPANAKSSLVPLVVLAILGYALFGSILLLAGSAFSKLGLWEKIRQEFSSELSDQNSEFALIPSSCGVSIPVPKTTQLIGETEYAWYYDETAFPADTFPLDVTASPRDFTVAGFLSFRPFTTDPSTTPDLTKYSAAVITCIENPKGLTLEELATVAESNKKPQIQKQGDRQLGEVPAVSVQSTSSSDSTATENGYFAVNQEGNRLIYISIWSDPTKQLDGQLLQTDFNTILNNLKNRSVPTDLVKPQQAPAAAKKTTTQPAAPSCTNMNIREGEFASNKCYTKSDYDDLVYYLQQFDRAVFDYNSAAGTANVTCDGFSENFKQSCEQSKEKMKKAQESMSGYRVAINAIIARGK